MPRVRGSRRLRDDLLARRRELTRLSDDNLAAASARPPSADESDVAQEGETGEVGARLAELEHREVAQIDRAIARTLRQLRGVRRGDSRGQAGGAPVRDRMRQVSDAARAVARIQTAIPGRRPFDFFPFEGQAAPQAQAENEGQGDRQAQAFRSDRQARLSGRLPTRRADFMLRGASFRPSSLPAIA